jgi:hypothetical protein
MWHILQRFEKGIKFNPLRPVCNNQGSNTMKTPTLIILALTTCLLSDGCEPAFSPQVGDTVSTKENTVFCGSDDALTTTTREFAHAVGSEGQQEAYVAARMRGCAMVNQQDVTIIERTFEMARVRTQSGGKAWTYENELQPSVPIVYPPPTIYPAK